MPKAARALPGKAQMVLTFASMIDNHAHAFDCMYDRQGVHFHSSDQKPVEAKPYRPGDHVYLRFEARSEEGLEALKDYMDRLAQNTELNYGMRWGTPVKVHGDKVEIDMTALLEARREDFAEMLAIEQRRMGLARAGKLAKVAAVGGLLAADGGKRAYDAINDVPLRRPVAEAVETGIGMSGLMIGGAFAAANYMGAHHYAQVKGLLAKTESQLKQMPRMEARER